MTTDNFTIRDNSSEFVKLLPSKYIEPLTIIARIKGYDGIDNYILELVKGRLQMFVDTADTVEYKEFQKYIHNMIIGKDVEYTWATEYKDIEEEKKEEVVEGNEEILSESKTDTKNKKEEEEEEKRGEAIEEIPITLKLKKDVAQIGRLIAKHYDEDFDKFVSEEDYFEIQQQHMKRNVKWSGELYFESVKESSDLQ